MAYEEVACRLLGETDNDGPNQLPAAIVQYYLEIVDLASEKYANLQQQLEDNEHHIAVLERANDNGKTPNFLKLKLPEVRLFPDNSVVSLKQSFQKALDKADQEMLGCTLKERHLLRAKLCKEAEELREEVEREAMTKWMEAQGDGWNGWDHLYPVTAEVKQGDNLTRVSVPLSAAVYRTAMKNCRLKVSTLMETKRLEKASETTRRKKEQAQRKAALAQASALPRQEAEKSIERRMQDMLKPLYAEISNLKERLQGNRSAPKAADAGGAASMSAKISRTEETHQDAMEQDDASEAKRKRRRRQRSTEAKAANEPAPAPPRSASGDQARRPGLKQSCNRGGRKRKGTAGRDPE